MAKETFSFEEAIGNTAGSESPARESNQKPPAQQRTLTEELGRQVGLTARGAVNGLASLPAMAADALITAPLNAGLALYDDLRAPTLSELVSGKKPGFRFPRQAAAIDKGMTQAGLPEPENAQERVVQDIVSGMAGTGGTIKAGQALANSGGALAKGIGETLAAGPKLQIASAASGAGAAGATRESGGSESSQVAAGVLGSLVPALAPAAGAAAARGVIRGGESGR
ncbi:MAG: hypothetical protein K2X64_06485, partial [Rhodocyclaceae bacterium]|nr:hypothetical protein [Rhodocyclaceae bacterium]